MPDPDLKTRPLSPHLTIYRPQINSVTSIFHRVTGVGLVLAAVLVVWWLVAASSGAAYFGFVDGLMTSWFGFLVLGGSLWALWYHFCTGVRHLIWDTGAGYGMTVVTGSGWVVVGASVLLTAATLLAFCA